MNTDYYEMLMQLQQQTQAWIRSNALRKRLSENSCVEAENMEKPRVKFDSTFLVNANLETK